MGSFNELVLLTGSVTVHRSAMLVLAETFAALGFKFAAKFLDIFLTVSIQRSMDTSSATFVAHFRHFATCHASASFTLPHIDQTCKIIDCVIVGIRVVIENIALVFFLGRIFFIITAVFN